MYSNIIGLDEDRKKKLNEFLEDFGEFVHQKGYEADIVGNGLITCLANISSRSNNLDQVIYMLRTTYSLYKRNEDVK